MKYLILFFVFAPFFSFSHGVFEGSRLYKKGYYAEVISVYESKLDQLSMRQTLQLAHSYYKMKSYFKAKILYYQVKNECELADVHKLALADILLSTGMLDLSSELLATCEDQTADQYDILLNKINWIRNQSKNFSPKRIEKVEEQHVNSYFEASTYFNRVILKIQEDRHNTIAAKAHEAQGVIPSENYKLVQRIVSNQMIAYVQNPYVTASDNTLFYAGEISIAELNEQEAKNLKREKKFLQQRVSLYQGSLKDGTSGGNQRLAFCQAEYNYLSPFVQEGKLYFSSDMPGGFGGFDLYVVEKKSDQEWGTPVNLGAEINSKGNEMYPTIVNQKIYFSSDTHAGFGGDDLFCSTKKDGQFETPLNLGAGINSGYDDITLVQGSNQDYLFISNRDNLKGFDEVFTVQNFEPNMISQK